MAANKVQVVSDEAGFHAYFDAAKNELDLQLQTLIPVIAELRLHRQIEYVLQTKGKRLRSALVMLSGESVGGNRQNLTKLALAVELLHSATLVHDDILDQDLFRRDALSVHAKWSVKEAILVGDALASLALSLCRGYKNEILDVMANTCLMLSDGEYMDVELSNMALSEDSYFEKVKKKSASLFKAAAQSGAIAENGSSREVNALAGFGENYGIAFQIRDDIEDVTSQENVLPPDFNECQATLPMIHLYETANPKVQSLLQTLAAQPKRTMSAEKIDLFTELRASLENHGSLRYCRKKIDRHIDEAILSIDTLKENVYKTYLIQMAQSLRLQ